MMRCSGWWAAGAVFVGLAWAGPVRAQDGAAAPAAPAAGLKPDRSAESLLRQVFRAHAGLEGVRLVIRADTRASAEAVFLYSRSVELWLGGNGRARMESFAAFGNGSRTVSDGKTVKIDPLSLSPGSAITLADLGKSLAESEAFAPIRSTPWILLTGGEPGLDAALAPESFIVEVPAPRGLRRIRTALGPSGVTEFTWRADDPAMRVIQVDFDGGGDWRAAVRGGRASVDLGSQVTRHTVVWAERGAKFAADLFATTPPVGFAVNDRRGARPGSTGTTTADPADAGEGEGVEGDGSPVLP